MAPLHDGRPVRRRKTLRPPIMPAPLSSLETLHIEIRVAGGEGRGEEARKRGGCAGNVATWGGGDCRTTRSWTRNSSDYSTRSPRSSEFWRIQLRSPRERLLLHDFRTRLRIFVLCSLSLVLCFHTTEPMAKPRLMHPQRTKYKKQNTTPIPKQCTMSNRAKISFLRAPKWAKLPGFVQ